MARVLRFLFAVCLCLMTYGLARANGVVWVALSETGGVYAEAADALRAEVETAQPGRVQWRVAPWGQFRESQPRPAAVVAVGTAAQRGMQALFAADAAPPPLLAVLVPRLAFERLADSDRLRAGSLSAVYLDQPAARQMELLRLALPAARKVGLLIGDDSRALVPAMERAARERERDLRVSPVGAAGLFPALQALLAEADVLLALPDGDVFNSQTVANILTAAYRRQVPLIGFSPAYTRAGALFSLYSTPAQVGTRGGEVLRQLLAGRGLPPPQWPREYAVAVNPDVARSMGLALDGRRLAEQLQQRERP